MLQTKIKLVSGKTITFKTEEKTELCDSVKIKNKRGQSAINAKERLELKYSDMIGSHILKPKKNGFLDKKREANK